MRTRQSSPPATGTSAAMVRPRTRRGWLAVFAFAVLFYAIALLLLYLLIVTWGLVQQRLAVSPPSAGTGGWANALGYPLTLAPAQNPIWMDATVAVALVLAFVGCAMLARRVSVVHAERPAIEIAPQWRAATKSASADSDQVAHVTVGARPASPGAPSTITPLPAASPRRMGEGSRAMSPGARSIRVFISHSSADNDFGHRLKADLEAKLGPGSVWYDSAGGLSGGDVWWDTITTELTERPVFVVILSPKAMQSNWVRDELRLAWQQKNGERGKVIVPVVHQPANVPVYVGMVQFVHFDNRPYERALADLLGAVADSQTRMIRPQDVPTLRAGPPFQESDLPMPERFVGRVEDLRWVEERLRAGGATGITAVRGMGGIGKTALAAVAVRELRWEGRFADGVAVVACNDLTNGLTDAASLLRKIILQFDAQGQIAPEADMTALGDVAREVLSQFHDALVVLDNVEPGLDIAAMVRPLRAAGVTVLLTARHQLPRAAVPDEGSKSLKLLSTDEALDLFAQSYGRFAAPDLTPGEKAAALRIVGTLDHHTLAVKLAGAYAKDESRDLAKLATALEDDPLQVPDDNETPRGVAVILGRSVTALDADGQRLFAALAAIPTNAFGRDALMALARGIGVADPDASASVLVRRALLDAALDETMPEASDRERRRLHPLLRADALARFEDDDWSDEQRNEARRAVAAYYAEYANAADDAALDPDEGNIDGAIDLAAALGDDALVARLCAGMGNYWRTRATETRERYLPLGLAAAQREAQRTGEPGVRTREANLHYYYGELLLHLGQLDSAADEFTTALGIYQALRSQRGEGVALSRLGDIALRRGALEEAEARYEQVLAIMREVKDRREEGVALSKLGDIALRRGALEEAEARYEQYLAIMREVKDQEAIGVALYKLAVIFERRGKVDEAESYHRESLEIAYQVKSPQDVADSLVELGRFLLERKRDTKGEGCAMLAEAARLYNGMGVPGAERARETARRLGCGG